PRSAVRCDARIAHLHRAARFEGVGDTRGAWTVCGRFEGSDRPSRRLRRCLQLPADVVEKTVAWTERTRRSFGAPGGALSRWNRTRIGSNLQPESTQHGIASDE